MSDLIDRSADNLTCAVGIDLGGSKIAGALVRSDGDLLAFQELPTWAEEGEVAVVERIARMAQSLLKKAPQAGDLLGLGVGVPGQVEQTSGVVRGSVNLGWEVVPLRERLQAHLGSDLPIWLEIDANTSAIGEFLFGAGRDCSDFVYLGLGTGLGGAAFVGGRLLEGASHYALEVGHLTLDPDGPICACGKRGCAEILVSGPGLVALTRQFLAQPGIKTRLEANADLDPVRIVAAARKGDLLAQAAVQKVGTGLGQVMALCASLLNPARILIGGGLGLAAFDLLIPPALEALRAQTLAVIHQRVEVLSVACRTPAVGAAALAWYYHV